MKRSIVSALLTCIALTILAGCATWSRKPTAYSSRGARTIALAITVEGVLQPTPQQYAAIQAKAVKEFDRLGYVIVTDISLAESIARIDFIPNPADPENTGRAVLLGFRANPLYAYANTSRGPYMAGYSSFPTSFGYMGSFSHTNWYALNNFGYGYYGYGNSYYDGYSYSTPTLNPVKPTTPVTTTPTVPPYRHDSDRCPPDFHRTRPIIDKTSPDYVAVARHDSPPSFSPYPGHWRRDPDTGGDNTSTAGSGSGSRSSRWGGSTSSGSSSSPDSTHAASWRRGESSGTADSSVTSASRGTWQPDRTWGSGHAADRGSWRDRVSSSGGGDRGSWRSGSAGSSYSSSSSSSGSSSSSYSSGSSSSYSDSSSSSSYSGGGSSYSGGSSGGGSYSGGATAETTSSRSQN